MRVPRRLAVPIALLGATLSLWLLTAASVGADTTASPAPAPATCALSAQGIQDNGGGFGEIGSNPITGLPGAIVSTTSGPVALCGSVVVAYHGDPAGGCARLDLCGVSGQLTWTPAGQGTLALLTQRRGGAERTSGTLTMFDPLQPGAEVTSEVTRIAPDGSVHECADAGASSGALAVTALAGGSVSVGGDADLAAALTDSRCAVPRGSDIAGALPSATLTVADLLRAGSSIDLSGVRTFSAPGLLGTVASTLTATTGRLVTQRSTPGGGAGGGGVAPGGQRYLTAKLTVESIGGSLTAAIAGPGDAAQCAVLDACGLSESVRLSPRGSGTLTLLAALAGGRGSLRSELVRTAGRGFALAFGQTGSGGSVTAAATRNDGSPTCTDAESLGRLALELTIVRGTAQLALADVNAGDPLRTRCPGPELADFPSPGSVLGAPLVSGAFSVASLLRNQLTVVLDHGAAAVASNGYSLRVTGALVLRLRVSDLRATPVP